MTWMPFNGADGELAIALLAPWLGAWILASAADDLVVLGAWLAARWRGKLPALPAEAELDGVELRRVAIFVPCWRESEVIAGMLRHNLAAIHYGRYEFFVGAYPNDEATVRAVEEVAAVSGRVHLAMAPHDGPTSKGDCLNWVYQRMLLWEETAGARFDLILMHDAEDLVHPEELRVVNWFAREYGFIQTPVLPLATPLREWVHGLYMDDFAEFHSKDLPARWWLGGFVPSSGVGTALRRDAVEALAVASSNRIFEPNSLTEDYELGCRMARLGVKQVFVPVEPGWGKAGGPLATREMFPGTFYSALRQRTRWVTGISLQGMERHGAGRTLGEAWWFWRDRKGVLGNPFSVVANLLFLYGLAGWGLAAWQGGEWRLGELLRQYVPWWMAVATGAAGVVQLSVRMVLSARVYGWGLAVWTPVRSLLGNFLNGAAAVFAVHRYLSAKWMKRPLVWLKTAHAYPSTEALRAHKQPIAEVLERGGYVDEEVLVAARAELTGVEDLTRYLVRKGLLAEGEVLEALSLQNGLEMTEVPVAAVRKELARSLPARVSRRYQVMPFAVEHGELRVASPAVPPEAWRKEARRYTSLNLRVVLVTETNFQELSQAFL